MGASVMNIEVVKYLAHRDHFWARASAKAKLPRLAEVERRNQLRPVILRPTPTCPKWCDAREHFARARAADLPRAVAKLRETAWANGWVVVTTVAEIMAPPTARRAEWKLEKRVTIWIQDRDRVEIGTCRAWGTWCNGTYEYGRAYVVGWPYLPVPVGARQFAEIVKYNRE